MKKYYDFSQGKQGKCYNPEAVFEFPIYLEPDTNKFMTELAKKKELK